MSAGQTWREDQKHTYKIEREERIAKQWLRNYDAHLELEKSTEEARAKLRKEAEENDVELQRRLRRSRFQHQNAARYFSTGTKGRITGYGT